MDTALDSSTSTASAPTTIVVARVETTKRTRTESIHSIFSTFGTELDAHVSLTRFRSMYWTDEIGRDGDSTTGENGSINSRKT